MKSYKKIAILFTAVISTFGVSSCKKLLEQNPKANITPQFFTTSGGVQGGITGVYSDMRNLWGTEGFLYYTNSGVDETLVGGGSSAGGTDFGTYSNYVNNVGDVYNGLYGIFGIAYQDINTLNGVLQYGPTAFTDVPTRTAYLAQAKFLRAFYYFHLVETFGAVPLHTAFISTPTLSDTRAPLADIYTQIIKDLTEASTELQSKPGETIASSGAASPFGGHSATKASALFLLSKVYLTRGWSTAAQGTDFQMALTTAQTLITNQSTYGIGLYASYADAYNEANDAVNKEDLFAIEHNTDPKYGNYTASPSSGAINGWAWFYRPNYPTINPSYPSGSVGGSVMTRDLANGRPFFRVRPNSNYVENVAFAEKTNDYRYWNTFQTTWISNTANITTPRGSLTVGVDTAIWMPPFDPGAAKRAAFKGIVFLRPSLTASAAGSNANPYTTSFFPSCKKFDDPLRPNVNDASQRPNVLFRFSEIYLIAAEAALKIGDKNTAATMINVLRTRAAARPAGAPAAPANAVTNMQITSDQVTLDFILDERTRELYGESLRWWDLTRTQSLVRRVQLYNAEAGPNIKDFMVLRPIPQTEIDLVTVGPKFPQNPGF